MGFPEVILPGDARNDLYVTVGGGSFSKGGGKSSERNIELVARVVDKNGQIIKVSSLLVFVFLKYVVIALRRKM